ncbi:CoA pyrophosphatase [Paraburkholderia hayleyella]|uniref:CoA pyrophosphatase n=1 Tax=Paraburkholderia hayleyella TaxID=2152889 RepID=UPI001292A273|nr:CoA pyrophosphatase [Paraburkholderia hayleyella]
MIRPVFEPEALPVESAGHGLPRVAPRRLSPDGLRERFRQSLPWTSEPVDVRAREHTDPRVAAVLIPLVVRAEGLSVLLTQRADHLHDHAGQVSFPGGRREPSDESAVATALREAEEEVGLDPKQVEVLGALPDYLTGTGFLVTPVVGLVHTPFSLEADRLEVAEIFEVPLAFLMNPDHHEVRVLRWKGGERRFFAMPYPRHPRHEAVPHTGGTYFIWGATASMLRNLYRFLAA